MSIYIQKISPQWFLERLTGLDIWEKRLNTIQLLELPCSSIQNLFDLIYRVRTHILNVSMSDAIAHPSYVDSIAVSHSQIQITVRRASLSSSLCQKQKMLEFCIVELVALEGWYGDPRKRFSNL